MLAHSLLGTHNRMVAFQLVLRTLVVSATLSLLLQGRIMAKGKVGLRIGEPQWLP